MRLWRWVATGQKMDRIESNEKRVLDGRREEGEVEKEEEEMSGWSAVPRSLLKYLYDMLTVSQESRAVCVTVCVCVRPLRVRSAINFPP